MTDKLTITKIQLVFLLFQTQIGIRVLELSYDLHKKVGISGWISVILTGIAVQLILTVMYFLCIRFPKESLYEFMVHIVGKKIAILLAFAFVAHFTLNATSVLSGGIMRLQAWAYPLTPPWAIGLLFLIIMLYFCGQNLRVIAQFDGLVSILFVLLVVLLIWGLEDSDIRYIFPLFDSGWTKIFKGIKPAWFAFTGMEIFLLSYMLVDDKKGVYKFLTFENVLVTLFYTFVVLVCSLSLTPNQSLQVTTPVLFLLKSLGTMIIERIDLIFMSIWLISLASTIISYIYGASRGLQHIFNAGNRTQDYVLYTSAIAFLFSLYLDNEQKQDILNSVLITENFVFIAVIPLLLLIGTLVGKKRGKGDGTI